jgi:hypothetical protein
LLSVVVRKVGTRRATQRPADRESPPEWSGSSAAFLRALRERARVAALAREDEAVQSGWPWAKGKRDRALGAKPKLSDPLYDDIANGVDAEEAAWERPCAW